MGWLPYPLFHASRWRLPTSRSLQFDATETLELEKWLRSSLIRIYATNFPSIQSQNHHINQILYINIFGCYALNKKQGE